MLVECVPNFSEGRDAARIERIVGAAAAVPGVSILHVDSGIDANRTVLTFAGTPQVAAEAAFQLIRQAATEIDMRTQTGAHPRLGATDVVPFVPLEGSTMEHCITAARRVGERVAAELEIPVYLYESAATRPERRNLADVRRGEYEGLPERLAKPEEAPDYGAPRFHPRAGATIIGARKFLVAFNVNLDTTDIAAARTIAAQIRTSGTRRGGSHLPGRLAACKAIGWMMPSFGCAQVSMNLTDLDRTGVFEAYQACVEEARRIGVAVTGSELIGLVPKSALLSAGRSAGASGTNEREIMSRAAAALGLDQFNNFELDSRVLEIVLKKQREHSSQNSA